MMQHYYGVEFTSQFENLFAGLAIANNKTEHASSFYVIKFDFSAINTISYVDTLRGMKEKILSAISEFSRTYSFFSEQELHPISEAEMPSEILIRFLDVFASKKTSHPLYVMVDEYDQFTNELMSFNLSDFTNTVSKNGFVRKFYEAVKEGVGRGIIARFFATGVTPVTLDSMTSGFNIAKDITLTPEFNEMLGFSEEEVAQILEYYEVENAARVLGDMRVYYNGSRFAPGAEMRLYNSNMIWYFLSDLIPYKRYPLSLTDNNIASDYSKMAYIVNLSASETKPEVLNRIFTEGETASMLTTQFSFQRRFTDDDMVSLLFYNGLLTLKEEYGQRFKFIIPNYSIRELYWDYFREKKEEELNIQFRRNEIDDDMYEFIYKGDTQRFLQAIEKVMAQLSNRDLRGFKEKDLKILVLLLCRAANVLIIESEVETSSGYIDLLLTGKHEQGIILHYCLELKYLQTTQKKQLTQVLEEGYKQAERYAKSLNRNTSYKPIALVFAGRTGAVKN